MNIFKLLIYLFRALLMLVHPGGAKALAAENIALRQQLITVARHRKRAPKLTIWNRLLFGLLTGLVSEARLSKIAILLKPSTLLKFHRALVKRKYHWLYAKRNHKKPGSKGPSQTVIDAIVTMKQKNMGYGHRRIAMQINLSFGLEIDKDIVRRVLDKYYRPSPSDSQGSSWLTFIRHTKDSLWSVDLFRCESIILKSYWVMVVLDQFTRRIVGFAVHMGVPDGVAVCCLFNRIISKLSLPKRLSSDNDPLFNFHRWQANLRILEIEESVPYVLCSYPFIERFIGTIRREFMNFVFFWNSQDLQRKLNDFMQYCNNARGHSSINSLTPDLKANNLEQPSKVISIDKYRWQGHCRDLYQLPKAA